MTVPIANPLTSYQCHKKEIDSAIHEILNSGWYILGNAVKHFESDFASYCGVAHAFGVANGTDALELALRAVGVTSGDHVVTVANTANATISAIERIGAIPFFVDIEKETFNINLDMLEPIFAAHSFKAIVVVHLYGCPVVMPKLCQIASAFGIPVIEDCAQAHGAMINGQRVGSFGAVSAFSFYPTKNLAAIGDGGAVATNDPRLADQLMLLRQYGWRTRYQSEIKGINSRLDEIQAAILSTKLPYLETSNSRRREIAQRYSNAFSDLPIRVPSAPTNCEHVYHQYTISTTDREELIRHLKAHGIGTSILYPVPIHRQPAYQHEFASVHLPITESTAKEILSLPVYPELTDEQVEHVIISVRSFFID